MTETTPFGEAINDLGDVEAELDRIKDLANAVGASMSNAFRRALTDGRTLRDLLGDIARRFADVVLKAALKPVGAAISQTVGSLFAGLNPTLGGVQRFARGGVINAPTRFASASGAGLAGEAGPEAILPLTRGPDGRLGVSAAGGRPIMVTMNISTPDARSFVAGEAEMGAALLRAVRRGTRAS